MSSRKKSISRHRLERNKGVLSESIVQYYLKHGQNRDLEKYLRLRSSRSSSDSSLPQHPADFIADRVHKSLENLSKLQAEASEREVDEEKSQTEEENKPKPEDGNENIDKTKNIKVSVKQQSDKKADSKKPFNFNVESVIEISVPPQIPYLLPAQITQPQVNQPTAVPTSSTSKEIISYSCNTQTQQNQSTTYDPDTSYTETPIKPVVKAPKSKRSLKENLENISPSSSVTSQSNKPKLEWDSLGDVGYDLGHDINQKYSLFNPNESERRALQTYFNQRGINFEEKVVLLANKDEKRVLESKEQLAEREKEAQLGAIRKNKEKWQKIYEKYKEKYNQSHLELSELVPDAQSTPRDPEMERKKRDEKSSQTSLVKNTTKGTQVDEIVVHPKLPPRVPTKKHKEPKNTSSVLEILESNGLYEEESPPKKDFSPVEIAESFEFIAGSTQEKSGESGITQISTGRSADTSTNTTKSSAKQETEISTFDEELKIAIALLNSLLDSKHMNADLKKSLVGKVIQKIVRIQTSKSVQTSTVTDDQSSSHVYSEANVSTNPRSSRRSSVISVLSSTLDSKVEKENTKEEKKPEKPTKRRPELKKVEKTKSTEIVDSVTTNPSPDTSKATEISKVSDKSKSSNESREKALHEFLKPMTHSEFDYQKQKLLKQQKKKNEQSSHSHSHHSQKSGTQLVEFLKEEKKSQLNWIEKEIDHLKNIRELLIKNGDTSSKNTTGKSSVFDVSENNKPVYENVEDSKSSSKEKCEDPAVVSISSKNSSNGNHRETSNKDTSNEKLDKPILHPKSKKQFNDWDSHTNMKKIIKNRSKLETPATSEHSDESLVGFIQKRKEIFLEKYEKQQQTSYQEDNDENLYTKPYSSQNESDNGHYSEPNEQRRPPLVQRRVSSQFLNGNPRKNSSQNASTSLASSECFVSSDSISIPIMDSNSTSNPSNYRKCRIIGTQTTDSIAKTKPIFENKLRQEEKADDGGSNENLTHTKLVDRTKNHKQLQTHPKSVKYTLTFERKGKVSVEKKFSSLPQKLSHPVISLVTEKSDKEIMNRMNSNSLDNRTVNEEKETLEEIAEDEMNLEKCLNQNRPKVWKKFEERRQCIQELRRLRTERNEQRKKLMLLTSDTSLENKLAARLPPSPLANKRLFTTKALKQQTKKQYQNLPEVQRKKEIEKKNNLKRKTRLLAEIFNKNLQKQVLSGNVDLSNSVNLINS